jgi:hypothetical protein
MQLLWVWSPSRSPLAEVEKSRLPASSSVMPTVPLCQSPLLSVWSLNPAVETRMTPSMTRAALSAAAAIWAVRRWRAGATVISPVISSADR